MHDVTLESVAAVTDINVNFHFLTHLVVPKLVILLTMVSEFELVLFSFHSTGF